MRVLWLFVLLPIVEIALFIQVGGLIGVWATLALVVLAAVLGVAVIRSQGAHAWLQAQRSLAELRDPSRPLAHGMMLMMAGLLLILPGFFTDVIGLLLLIPPLRNLVMRQAGRRMRVRTVQMARRESYRPPYADGVIDADYVVEDTPPRPHPPLDLPEDLAEDGSTRRGNSGWTRHRGDGARLIEARPTLILQGKSHGRRNHPQRRGAHCPPGADADPGAIYPRPVL